MTRETYEKMTSWFRERPAALQGLKLFNKLLTAVVYVAYAITALVLILNRSEKCIRFILVPALTFIFGSVLRDRIDAPRPYEVFELPPLIRKETKGHSFPSRHTFCAAVIACACCLVSPIYGALMFLVSIGIGAGRVLAGVHWPKDVVAAEIFGLLCGIVGFVVL